MRKKTKTINRRYLPEFIKHNEKIYHPYSNEPFDNPNPFVEKLKNDGKCVVICNVILKTKNEENIKPKSYIFINENN